MAFTLGRDEPNGLVRDARRAATPDSLRYCPIDDQDGRNLTRSRRSYFSDAFSLREVYNSPREQINNRSSVIVEIKTNVKIQITEVIETVAQLSGHLAQIYQRPQNCMVVQLDHSCNLMIGRAVEPAYLMTVSALPFVIAPVSNIRNTVLIQTVVHDLLHIPPNRGVIKYVPVAYHNLATNGFTAKAEVERLEMEAIANAPSLSRSIARNAKGKLRSKRSYSTPLYPLPEVASLASDNDGQDVGDTHFSDSESGRGRRKRGSRFLRSARSIRQFFSGHL